MWDYIIGFSKELAVVLILIFMLLLGIELISSRSSVKIEEAILSESPSIQKVISSGGDLTKDDVLELTLSNGKRK